MDANSPATVSPVCRAGSYNWSGIKTWNFNPGPKHRIRCWMLWISFLTSWHINCSHDFEYSFLFLYPEIVRSDSILSLFWFKKQLSVSCTPLSPSWAEAGVKVKVLIGTPIYRPSNRLSNYLKLIWRLLETYSKVIRIKLNYLRITFE